MADGSLNYVALEMRVSEYALKTSDTDRPGTLERWSFLVGWIVAGTSALVGTLIGGKVGLYIVWTGLAAELICFLIAIVCLVRREWRTFHRPHKLYSKELEEDFHGYRELVRWVCEHPIDDIGQRLRYLRDRKLTFAYRFGVITGGMERYGLLPVLVVLYLQFKDWSFGDWQALGHVHMVGGLLLWALVILYLGAWSLVRLKSRMDTYEALLAEALLSKEQEAKGA